MNKPKTNVEEMLLMDVQAAAALNLSPSHFRSLVNSGKAPQGIKLGKSRRWSVEGLRKWIALKCPTRIEMKLMQNEKKQETKI